MPERGEAGDVVRGRGREGEADGGHVRGGEAASTQHDVDERTPGAAVAVQERVDRLELRVRERGLSQRRQIVGVQEGAEVLEQRWHRLVRWRNELRDAGRLSSDPVLLLPHDTGPFRVVAVLHEHAVDGQHVVQVERARLDGELDGRLHRGDVAEHGFGGDVGKRDARLLGRLVAHQPAVPDGQPLDAGRRDSLGAQQDARERLQLLAAAVPEVQTHDVPLGVSEVCRHVTGEQDVQAGQAVGDERGVRAWLSLAPRGHGR